jgi:hypothetical protein
LNNEPDTGSPASHGICNRCFDNVLVKIGLLGSLRNAVKATVEGDRKLGFGSQPASQRFQ